MHRILPLQSEFIRLLIASGSSPGWVPCCDILHTSSTAGDQAIESLHCLGGRHRGLSHQPPARVLGRPYTVANVSCRRPVGSELLHHSASEAGALFLHGKDKDPLER